MPTIMMMVTMLFYAAMAQQQTSDSSLDGLWFHITSAGNPFLQSSQSPCLLRGRPVVRRDDYTYTQGVGAHKFHKRGLLWAEARRTCEEEGGHLAIINSIAESNAIAALYQNSGSTASWAYIGFHDLFQEGEYVTIHGQSVAEAGFTGWLPSDPNGGNEENCGAVEKNGGLVDIWCDRKEPFICELPIN